MESKSIIHLDYQAGTPVHPEVWEAMKPFFSEKFGNSNSFHKAGLEVRSALQKAREQVAAFIGAESPEEIIFTANGTEAANLAIKGTAWTNKKGKQLIASAVEHPAIWNSIQFLQKQGWTSQKIRVDSNAFVSVEEMEQIVTPETILVAVQLANHDVGTLQPVTEVAAKLSIKNIPFFCDATAAAGWIPINVQRIECALLTLTPYRFYGPKGVGILYCRKGHRLEPLIHGGIQEYGIRAGTENVPAIVGTGVACEIAGRELEYRSKHVFKLKKLLCDEISKQISHLRFNSPMEDVQCVPHLLNVSIRFVEGEGLVLMLDLQGVRINSGPACLTGFSKISPVLEAMGIGVEWAKGSILFSFGEDNTEKDVLAATERLSKVVERLRGMSESWKEFQAST